MVMAQHTYVQAGLDAGWKNLNFSDGQRMRPTFLKLMKCLNSVKMQRSVYGFRLETITSPVSIATARPIRIDYSESHLVN